MDMLLVLRNRLFFPRALLAILLLVSGVLHFTGISFPSLPVFDEVHFVTYASAYANRDGAFFDIHPPLGKILYAVPLVLNTRALPNTAFLAFHGYDKATDRIDTDFIFRPYGDFPYVPLRAISAAFGLLLIAALYLFTSRLSGSEWAGLLAALLVAFDNSFLVETRVALLNGMYLALGFLALAFLIGQRPRPSDVSARARPQGDATAEALREGGSRPILAGILFGLSLSVKLVGIVFVGPLIVLTVFRDISGHEGLIRRSDIVRFCLAAGAVFLLILFFANNVILPINERLLFYGKIMGYAIGEGATTSIARAPLLLKAAANSLLELNTSISGYLVGVSAGAGQSVWYLWPIMWHTVLYAIHGSGGLIALTGNPFVWTFSAASIFLLFLWLRKLALTKKEMGYLLLLFAWIVFSLLPFAAFVQRPAYLYHYFPALLFGISLFSTLVVYRLRTASRQARWLTGTAIVILVTTGFISLLPYTYGFPV